MKYLKLLVLLVFIGCGTPKVLYDYDSEADFNSYKTFRFYDDINLNTSDIETKRILTQLERAIVEKGFSYNNIATIYVDVKLNQFEAPKNSIGVGFGNYGRHSGINIGGQIPINNDLRTYQFTIDFIDSKTDKLVWQGIYEGNFNTSIEAVQKEQQLAIAFQKLFSKYPPKKK
jgi:hypothetical protein